MDSAQASKPKLNVFSIQDAQGKPGRFTTAIMGAVGKGLPQMQVLPVVRILVSFKTINVTMFLF